MDQAYLVRVKAGHLPIPAVRPVAINHDGMRFFPLFYEIVVGLSQQLR